MPRLTFGIALDFGSKLRPLDEQLERQSALLEDAEAAGFEMVAAGESSAPGGFHLPNALLVLTTLVQRTRLGLCTGVALLPAWPVWRLALDTAQLDQLSGGRVTLGIGLGSPSLQQRAGWPAEAIAATADEYLQCLRQLWLGAAQFSGKHIAATGQLPIQPRNPNGVPIWVGGGIRRSAQRAARLGDGWYAGVSFSLSSIPRQVTAYREALGGRAGAVAVNRLTVVSTTDEAQQFVSGTLRSYAQQGQPLQEVMDDLALVGTPDQVAGQLERYVAAGVTHVFARLSLDEMPLEVARGTIELMGREVIPRFVTHAAR
jgi:alkanesulfonate monooxygenase SsuD/methylene tetrahydromethanopterin reductase-like flavin-dependent oxidoreductase (luciferase family)